MQKERQIYRIAVYKSSLFIIDNTALLGVNKT